MRKIIVLLVVIVSALLVWSALLLRPVSSDTTQQVFRVDSGQGVNQISHNLRTAKLIRSSQAFEILLWLMKSEGKIRSGTYSIAPNANLFQIIDALLTGRFSKKGNVTLIEGWGLKEYRDYLTSEGYSGDAFDVLARDVSTWKNEYSFLHDLGQKRTLEGYLFPDTYAVDTDRDAKLLIRMMLDNFDRKLSDEVRDEIARQQRSIDEVVILASIVEKEVATTADRKKVADIFLKRLKEGIALQSDATVNYVTGSGRSRSTAADLAIDSLYNTYKYRGLPPGPIGNPSLDAILTVIYPESNPYYYFLTDTKGTVYYAKTFTEHQKNKQKYL